MLGRERLTQNLNEGLEHARRFFMGTSDVHQTLERLASTLTSEGIPYAICGGMALTAHGFVRVTEDVDVILTPEGLATFKERWLGRGWVERFEGSRGLRDAVTGVQVDVLVTGDFPGDGQPKPVAIPDPSTVAIDLDGKQTVNLDTLLELKLASGMTAPHRPRDLDDVIRLIRANELPRDHAEHLDAYVREKFEEMWELAQVEDEA